jgi:hypothetical protein
MIMKSIQLGKVAGLKITAHRTEFIGFVLLWAILYIALTSLPFSPLACIIGAYFATLLHYASELWHQLGHAWAAQSTGYPMIGVRYWWILGASIYPKDEPPLPGSIHIRRALGGPLASIILTLITGTAYLLLGAVYTTLPYEHTLYRAVIEQSFLIAFFFFLDNLFVFTLGAFLPLGFTDGSTILRWRGK